MTRPESPVHFGNTDVCVYNYTVKSCSRIIQYYSNRCCMFTRCSTWPSTSAATVSVYIRCGCNECPSVCAAAAERSLAPGRPSPTSTSTYQHLVTPHLLVQFWKTRRPTLLETNRTDFLSTVSKTVSTSVLVYTGLSKILRTHLTHIRF